ncbi:MAG: sigma 54-interacting transcriptional regulator [Planctomycetia bacterium]
MTTAVVSPDAVVAPATGAGVAARSPRRLVPSPRITGSSPAAAKLEFEIGRAAQFDSCVLISGETGSGKEAVARAIHAAGPRRDRPFVAINCAALTPTLAESQLFGHVKGAFTGAVGNALGVFRAADGGVVFLDEIGELPLEVQPKLLRVIQQREVTPVGSTDVFPFDVQILAATNRNLELEVQRAGFRPDLLYRLNTIEIAVPALRERASDIPLLVRHFSEALAARLACAPWTPDAETLSRMLGHRWPGNIRQLAQFVERVYVFGSIPVLADEAPLRLTPSAAFATTAPPPAVAPSPPADEPTLPVFNLDELRRLAVRQALVATGGHKGRAAAMLGVHLNTMTKFVAELSGDAIPPRRVGRPRRPR